MKYEFVVFLDRSCCHSTREPEGKFTKKKFFSFLKSFENHRVPSLFIIVNGTDIVCMFVCLYVCMWKTDCLKFCSNYDSVWYETLRSISLPSFFLRFLPQLLLLLSVWKMSKRVSYEFCLFFFFFLFAVFSDIFMCQIMFACRGDFYLISKSNYRVSRFEFA